MTEKTKTLLFVLVAVVILLVAWAAQPRRLEERPPELVGQLLVPADFDPLKAASLEIVKYDEKEARVETFEVAHDKQKGVWSIPSHENYPADAKEHMAEAATTFVGAKILQLVSESPGDHKQYGVLEPDPRDPSEGMGTRVIIKDKDNNPMVAVIIGKKVPGQSDLYYVRRVGQDQVFVVSLNTDRLSTRFEDWIEKDLLKLNPWDIKEVEIRDYSVDIVRGIIIQRGQMTLEYNDTGDPRWKLVQDLQATERGLQQQGLGPDEELNTTKLDDMKFALDDLKIVDVNRKPPGLSADLKAEQTLISNKEAVENLAARGFYPARVDDRYEIVSNEGEIRVLMKDGVEYLLRFGGPAGTGRTEEKQTPKPESKPGEKTPEQKTTPGMNRFIMVTARFNESAIPKPELQPLPEETPPKTDSQPKPQASPAANPAEAKTEPQPAPASQTSAEPKPEAKPAHPSETTPTEKSQPEGKEKTEPKKSPEEAKKELEKRREEIKKENERKQKEYQEKLEQGRKKAKELNDRFADWYYIISEDTYKKIRLSRSDIVKKKEKPQEEKSKEGAEKQPAEKADKHEPGQPEHKHPPEEQPKPAAPGAESAQPAAKSMPGEQPKAAEQPKPAEPPKPAQQPKQPESPPPGEKPMPSQQPEPTEQPKPAEQSKPAEPPKPAQPKPPAPSM
jgi:hypothetical protein